MCFLLDQFQILTTATKISLFTWWGWYSQHVFLIILVKSIWYLYNLDLINIRCTPLKFDGGLSCWSFVGAVRFRSSSFLCQFLLLWQDWLPWMKFQIPSFYLDKSPSLDHFHFTQMLYPWYFPPCQFVQFLCLFVLTLLWYFHSHGIRNELMSCHHNKGTVISWEGETTGGSLVESPVKSCGATMMEEWEASPFYTMIFILS